MMTLDTVPYMLDPKRAMRRHQGDEREMLTRFLEFQRDTVIWKLNGLRREQLIATHTPSGMSLLGLVKHLAYVERNWFQIRFSGRSLFVPWRAGKPDTSFRIDPDDTPESVLDFYLSEIQESRRILEAADSLGTLAQAGKPPRPLRWIVIHMIEETARHAGHADFMREFTDGQTGE